LEMRLKLVTRGLMALRALRLRAFDRKGRKGFAKSAKKDRESCYVLQDEVRGKISARRA
jgi:hypothetical protein